MLRRRLAAAKRKKSSKRRNNVRHLMTTVEHEQAEHGLVEHRFVDDNDEQQEMELATPLIRRENDSVVARESQRKATEDNKHSPRAEMKDKRRKPKTTTSSQRRKVAIDASDI